MWHKSCVTLAYYRKGCTPCNSALLYGTAVLACGLCAAQAQADPVTATLYYTTFSGTPNVHTTSATLNGTSLTFSGTSNIASTAGADGIAFAPDGNLLIGGQNTNNPAQVHEITTGGAAVASANTTANSNGSYHLALSADSPTATLYTLCNTNCGANLTSFVLSGGGLVNGSNGTRITVSGGRNSDQVTGLVFDTHNSTWYYGTTVDGSTSGDFGTVTFSGTAATLHTLLTGVAAHGVTFDPLTNDIIFSSGNEISSSTPAPAQWSRRSPTTPAATNSTSRRSTDTAICSSPPITATWWAWTMTRQSVN
jgi:hypothetical protein